MSRFVDKCFKIAAKKCKKEGRELTLDDVKEVAYSLTKAEEYAQEYSKAYAQGVEECHINLAINGIKNGKSLEYIADILSINEDEVKTLLKKKIASLLEISFDDTEALIKVLSD